MLGTVKLAVRVTSNKFNDELNDLIESAKMDLSLSGVKKLNEEDSLIKQAIKLYVKANFGLNNKEAYKYQKAYNSLKIHLALSEEYTNVE